MSWTVKWQVIVAGVVAQLEKHQARAVRQFGFARLGGPRNLVASWRRSLQRPADAFVVRSITSSAEEVLEPGKYEVEHFIVSP